MSSITAASYDEALALREAGQLSEALSLLQPFSKHYPYHHQAWLTAGFIYGQLNQFELSIAAFDRTLELDPGNEQAITYREVACIGLAQSLAKDQKWQAALDQLDAILKKNPTHIQMHFERGRILKLLGRHRDALRAFEQVTTLDSARADAYFECAEILRLHGFFEPALFNFKKTTTLNPDNNLAYQGLAIVHKALKSHNQALDAIKIALTIEPDNDTSHQIRQDILLDLRQGDRLLHESAKAVAENPSSVVAISHHAGLLSLLGQFDQALVFYDQALAIEPAHTPARHGKGGVLSALGQWRDSYIFYPSIARGSNQAALKSFGKPIWDGSQKLADKHLLVYFEAGLGDAIMHVRFALHLAKQNTHHGIKITLQVSRGLTRLFSGLDGISQVIRLEDPVPEFDYTCSQLGLAAALQIESDAVPYANHPYLATTLEWREAWQKYIDLLPKSNLRVGLVWAGGYASYDFRRSLALTQFQPLMQIASIDYFSFQKGDASTEWAALESQHHCWDFSEHIHDYADTAVLMEQMDLIIGSDTSVLHLACAMGKPAWLLCRFDGSWIDHSTSTCPWYSSLRVYKQTSMGEWDTVIDRVVTDLKIYETLRNNCHEGQRASSNGI